MKGGMFLVAVWLEKLTRTVHSIVCRAKATSRYTVAGPPGEGCRGKGAVQVLLKQLTTAK